MGTLTKVAKVLIALDDLIVGGTTITNTQATGQFKNTAKLFAKSAGLNKGQTVGSDEGIVHKVVALEYNFRWSVAANTVNEIKFIGQLMTDWFNNDEQLISMTDPNVPAQVKHECVKTHSKIDAVTSGSVTEGLTQGFYYELPLPIYMVKPYYANLITFQAQNGGGNGNLTMDMFVYFTAIRVAGKDYRRMMDRMTGGYGGQSRRLTRKQ